MMNRCWTFLIALLAGVGALAVAPTIASAQAGRPRPPAHRPPPHRPPPRPHYRPPPRPSGPGFVGGIITGAIIGGIVAGAAAPPPPPPIVTFAPPAPVPEYPGPPPGPGLIWVGGYWGWGGANYVWTPGRWERIPPSHRGWVAGRWAPQGHGWHWTPGYWQ